MRIGKWSVTLQVNLAVWQFLPIYNYGPYSLDTKTVTQTNFWYVEFLPFTLYVKHIVPANKKPKKVK